MSTAPAAVLTWRTPSDSGVECHAREFVDIPEARRIAVHLAEVYGSCRVSYVRDSDVVLHSRAVPHGQIPLAAEVILGDSRP